MSRRPISRSDDLRKLQDEGYDLEIRSSYLLVKHVPFRDAAGGVSYGTLMSGLELAGDLTVQPHDHRAWFVGGVPHGSDGGKLSRIINNDSHENLAPGIVTDCMFSTKPLDGRGYRDYHHKVVTHVSLISTPAKLIEPKVTATTFPVIVDDDDESVFHYVDTASSRAGIVVAAERLKRSRVAIVGLGGTGSYILDFLAKTPVREIHIFDGDLLLQHNAFRSPGAPSAEELQERRTKVDHHARTYARMRSGIVVHNYFIDSSNVGEVREMDFVFVAADSGPSKTLIATALREMGVPFVDVGMGLYQADGRLGGIMRTTASTSSMNEHIASKGRISSGGSDDDPYAQSIQIAELNALNAALAVIKWKKTCDFYLDDELEHHSLYVLGGNEIINADQLAGPEAQGETSDAQVIDEEAA
jgi:hypothetical protein